MPYCPPNSISQFVTTWKSLSTSTEREATEMPETEEYPWWERQLRKQLLLLATLVLCATYVAGINPPGGVLQENWSGHKTGDDIRYLSFYYFNSTALAASVVVIFLLLLKKPRWRLQLVILPVVLLLGLLGLLMLCIVASPANLLHLLYPAVLVSTLLTYIGYQVWQRFTSRWWQQEEEEELDDQAPLRRNERRKVLMLLTSFTTVSTYVAGLSSYWDRVRSSKDGEDGLHREAKARFGLFYNFNVTAFMASLTVVTLQCTTTGPLCRSWEPGIRSAALFVSILAVLLGLLGAYAARTCDSTDVYVLCLIAGFLAYISLVILMRCCRRSCWEAGAATTGGVDEQEQPLGRVVAQLGSNAIRRNEETRKVQSLILLLATLAATVTYQAGMHPPGGVWPDDRDGHRPGYSILFSTQPSRYKVFIYCNSSAFMLSLYTIRVLMIHKEKIHTTLLVLVILDMVALMGAYAAGSWIDARSSLYVLAMAGGVIVYLTTHVVCVILNPTDMDYRRLKKRHKRLVLIAILIATVTYQAGLNPPGGFRRKDDDGHTAGAALLMEYNPRRFWAFFFCNTTSHMASMALILVFFVSPNLDRLGIRCYALFYTCIVLALLGVMAAYAAATVKLVQQQACVFGLLASVVTVAGVRTIQSRAFLLKKEEEEEEEEDQVHDAGFGLPIPRTRPINISRPRLRLRSAQETKYRQAYANHKHLLLLGILAASITYQAGLNPPSGLWQDHSDHEDRTLLLYHIFFVANSTSFVASVFIVALQLQQIMQTHQPKHSKLLVLGTNFALGMDMLSMLTAYAIGTSSSFQYDSQVVFVGCGGLVVAGWIMQKCL